jgi:hypothetical protein
LPTLSFVAPQYQRVAEVGADVALAAPVFTA